MLPSLSQYITNPSGKGTAFLASRKMILTGYKAEYLMIMNKKSPQHKILMNAYEDKKAQRTYLHFKIPSSNDKKVPGVSYDVVFELDTSLTSNILSAPINFFSNCPSFVYSGLAYLLNEEESLVEFLKPKLPKESYTKKPSTRNPKGVIGYEKTFVMAYLFLLDYNIKANLRVEPFKKKELLKRIASLNDVLKLSKLVAKKNKAAK